SRATDGVHFQAQHLAGRAANSADYFQYLPGRTSADILQLPRCNKRGLVDRPGDPDCRDLPGDGPGASTANGGTFHRAYAVSAFVPCGGSRPGHSDARSPRNETACLPFTSRSGPARPPSLSLFRVTAHDNVTHVRSSAVYYRAAVPQGRDGGEHAHLGDDRRASDSSWPRRGGVFFRWFLQCRWYSRGPGDRQLGL